MRARRVALLSLALAWVAPISPLVATEPESQPLSDADEALLEFLGSLDAEFDSDGEDDDWVEFLASTDVKRAAAKAPPPAAPKPAPGGRND